MNNKAYLAIIGILLLISVVLGYKLFTTSETVAGQEVTIEEGNLERDRLELELERMLLSYDTLKTENSVLAAEMAAQRAEIESLLKKVKDKDWSIHKLKKEADTLREIMKGYVVTIDSLNTLNDSLFREIDIAHRRISDVEQENMGLEERQERMESMIAEGQILQTNQISCLGIRLRSSGKQVDTKYAKRTEMIKTCFNIFENRIAEPGEKIIHVRIIGPDGKVLPAESGESLSFDGEMSTYSVKRTIDYNNAEMDVCVFYNVQGELEKGDYKVFIYEGTTKIGQSDLILK
ncbi:MAG: hypothetical protein KDC12_14650 [Flavobacteriales bacterium]|nr:hypothetical protein [Flavobacteriales bacterium]